MRCKVRGYRLMVRGYGVMGLWGYGVMGCDRYAAGVWVVVEHIISPMTRQKRTRG